MKFKIVKNILTLILLIFGTIYVIYDTSHKDENIKNYKINYELTGIIDSVYTDENNHNYTTIIFTNNKRITTNPFELKRYQKGDSIVKKKGSDSLYVFRNGVKTGYKF